jgi:hypothetical protein
MFPDGGEYVSTTKEKLRDIDRLTGYVRINGVWH